LSALQLETAARILGPVLDEVVFVGGATVHLWITEPGAPPARATEDVDVICEVATRVKYHRLGIDGRPELASEIEAASPDLRSYVRDELVQLQAEHYFDYAVDGATAGYGPLGADRADLVRERLHQLIFRC
jgi:hypothetical protein